MKKILPLFASLVLIQSASGVITVHFTEEGADVRVSFSGSINLSDNPVTDSRKALVAASPGVTNDAILIQGLGYNVDGAGFFSPSGLAGSSGTDPITNSAFGFFVESLQWDDRHVTGGTLGGTVTELTADPVLDTFMLLGSSLATLNAEASDIAEGATLWTSNGTTADTFVFSRIAPVPEPSTALLGILGTLGLLRRSR